MQEAWERVSLFYTINRSIWFTPPPSTPSAPPATQRVPAENKAQLPGFPQNKRINA